MEAEQREGLSPNRGCRASLFQTPQTTRGWEPGTIPDGSRRPGHLGRWVPSPTHGYSTTGEKAVMFREFVSSYHSNEDKEQTEPGDGGSLGK